MGEASARAQGLSKPITTAERLRNAEHQKVYLLVDREAKKYVILHTEKKIDTLR